MTYAEASAAAIAKGATRAEIEAEAVHQRRHVGTVPFKNMIKALTMMTGLNTKDDWTRLAAALLARSTRTAR